MPTRQAFLTLVVRDDEREATATVTNAGRTVAQAMSWETCRRVAPVSARERAG